MTTERRNEGDECRRNDELPCQLFYEGVSGVYLPYFLPPTSVPLVLSPSLAALPSLTPLAVHPGLLWRFYSCPLPLFLPRMKNKWCCAAWCPDADDVAVVFHGISPRRSVLRFRLTRRYFWRYFRASPIYYACHVRSVVPSRVIIPAGRKTLNIYIFLAHVKVDLMYVYGTKCLQANLIYGCLRFVSIMMTTLSWSVLTIIYVRILNIKNSTLIIIGNTWRRRL